jgi:Leucine-rich repeat (LRR) protein
MTRLGVAIRAQAADLQRVTVACGAVWLVLGTGLARADIPANERAALIALYNSTNGTAWLDRTSWRNAANTDFAPAGTECTWYGVICDGLAAHVSGLTLDDNHVTGAIPPEIGDLTALTTLLLRRNGVSGSIPPAVWSLTGLVTLALGSNYLTGSLPAAIGNLTALEGLDLSANALSGPIPPEIGSLARLRFLSLAGNRLTGSIPAEVGTLASLSLLHLYGNGLTGPIPFQLGNLSLLEELDLSSNQLTGPIPLEITDLTRLRLLSLAVNGLTGSIPPEIGNLRSLTALYLQTNELTGTIPPEIGKLTALTDLQLGGAGAGGRLTGAIPPEIGNLTALEWLVIANTALTGAIPPEIGALRRLSMLYLRDNELSGPIPRQIGNLTNLIWLIVPSNRLSGAIPAEIGNLAHLQKLELENNSLDGPIPPEFGNLTTLQSFGLGGNRLRGPIPVTLMNLTGLFGHSSDLRYNALYTSDPSLRDFLTARTFGDWEGTQTVAPTGLSAGSPTLDSVPLSWLPIRYTRYAGGYRVWYGTLPGGPYNLAGTTADKLVSASTVGGLSPGTTYYFALDTVTEPNPVNPNTVFSDRSAEVSATTPAAGPHWHGLSVVREGRGTVSSSPGAIHCGGACLATFAPGTLVTLTAIPESGSTFLGWGGECAGRALTCDVTIGAASVQTATAAFSPQAVSFYTVTPCRAYDSRDLVGPRPLPAGAAKPVLIGGYCGIPAAAKAVSLNVTVVSPSAGGHLRLYASGAPRPTSSSINYGMGQTRANNAVVPLGADGAIAVSVNQPSGTVHVVLDVNGYFQ